METKTHPPYLAAAINMTPDISKLFKSFFYPICIIGSRDWPKDAFASTLRRVLGNQGHLGGGNEISSQVCLIFIMQITNLNPDSDIGASAWLVEIEDHRILLDAGMHPKRDGRAALPLYSVAGDKEVDAIAISHCHHDHVGSLPVAMRHFPSAHVLMTELSYFLAGRVLHNSVNVMIRQREEHGIREYPLFTHEEVERNEAQFQDQAYNREAEWAHLLGKHGRDCLRRTWSFLMRGIRSVPRAS